MTSEAESLRLRIRALAGEHHAAALAQPEFRPGETAVSVAGPVFDDAELQLLMDSGLDSSLTPGRYATEFEREFAAFMEVREASLVNSGSSANLLAVSALTSPQLGDRRLSSGDEVITVAAGFPTTVNPILQCGLMPVFVDVDIPTYNIDVRWLEEARSQRTRAIFLAHTLGNPFDLGVVTAFARRHHLWLIEDCGDALGATYNGRSVGSFGDMSTASFYPTNHITMGEGGCVLTSKPMLKTIVDSFRDCGRYSCFEPGKENACGKQSNPLPEGLPFGYDHQCTHSHMGYNLEANDMQAAIGVARLKKLPCFVHARRRNFNALRTGLQHLEEFLILPEATPGSNPSWSGFPIGVRATSPYRRHEIVQHLERQKIAAEFLSGGNMLRQPADENIRCRQVGQLTNSDFVAEHVFRIGVHPGLTEHMISFVIETFSALFK